LSTDGHVCKRDELESGYECYRLADTYSCLTLLNLPRVLRIAGSVYTGPEFCHNELAKEGATVVCPETCIEHCYPVESVINTVSPRPEKPGTLVGITRLLATFYIMNAGG
jgi:hypothetical protein